MGIKRVLVVDDSLTMRQLQCLILRDAELSVTEAADGLIALASIERERPDAVVLDVNMPEVDGRETFARLRRMDGCADLPVVFVTADDEVELPRDAYTASLRKPLNADDLRRTVRTFVGLPPESERRIKAASTPER